MRIIARNTLTRFVQSLARQKDRSAVKSALDAWFHEAQRATWHSPAAVKKSYRTASIIDEERVVFNIKGNAYRLVTSIHYERQIVFIKWLGSHSEYDRIDVRKVEYGDQTYQKQRRS
jgi:mRNA interferase HigB